jgi:hypothetical protein
MTSGSSLVLPANSSTPTISSSFCRFTIVYAFLKFSGRVARFDEPRRVSLRSPPESYHSALDPLRPGRSIFARAARLPLLTSRKSTRALA